MKKQYYLIVTCTQRWYVYVAKWSFIFRNLNVIGRVKIKDFEFLIAWIQGIIWIDFSCPGTFRTLYYNLHLLKNCSKEWIIIFFNYHFNSILIEFKSLFIQIYKYNSNNMIWFTLLLIFIYLNQCNNKT